MIVPLVLVATAASAVALYSVNYDTRGIAAEVRRLEREIDRIERDHRVLEAERANLVRPERIERLMRQHLDLAPLDGSQLGAVGDVPFADEIADADAAKAPASDPIARILEAR